MFIDFRERKKHQCRRETLVSCLSYVLSLGIKSATQICALIGIRTHNILVHGTWLQATEPPAQGFFLFYFKRIYEIKIYIHQIDQF